MVVNAIKKCDLDLRKTLYNSIIAAGGTTMLHGFGDRLHKSI
jgi:centractin